MGLDFPNPASVAAYIRSMIRNTPEDIKALIVEGKTDRAALLRLLHPDVLVIPASNKEKTLGARKILSSSDLVNCTFLVDCDGDLDAPWRSFDNVIISDWRDLDADMAIKLEALSRIVSDYLAEKHATGVSLDKQVAAVLKFVILLTAFCGTVTDAAISLNAPIRIFSEKTKRRRRIRADDLPEFKSWVKTLTIPSVKNEIIPSIARLLEWNIDTETAIIETCSKKSTKLCRNHNKSNCLECLPRTYVNGHDLISVLGSTLNEFVSTSTAEKDLSRLVRLSLNEEKISDWSVMKKIKQRGLSAD